MLSNDERVENLGPSWQAKCTVTLVILENCDQAHMHCNVFETIIDSTVDGNRHVTIVGQ